MIVSTTNDFGFWAKCQNENFQMRTELYPESWCLISRSPTGQSRSPKSQSRTLKSRSRTLKSNSRTLKSISRTQKSISRTPMSHMTWRLLDSMQLHKPEPRCHTHKMSGSQPHTNTATCAELHSHSNSRTINCLHWLEPVSNQCSTLLVTWPWQSLLGPTIHQQNIRFQLSVSNTIES